MNAVRWLAVLKNRILIFGVPGMVARTLARYERNEPANAMLVQRIARLHPDDDSWSIIVEQGEYVTNGFVGDKGAKGYVVTLADLDDLQVELDISQNDFSKIHMGSKAFITTDAYPDRKYDGELVEISPIANRQKATVQVKVQILDPDNRLRPDMNATVAFVDATHSGQEQSVNPVITIPAAAVNDQSVFVVSDGRAVRHHVQISASTPLFLYLPTRVNSLSFPFAPRPPRPLPGMRTGTAVRRQLG